MRNLLAGVVVLLMVAAPASAAAKPRLLARDSSNALMLRPGQLVISGDASEIVGGTGWTQGSGLASFGRIRWSAFNRREAVGRGFLWVNDCDPNCADGTFQQHTAWIHASSVTRSLYQRLTVRYMDDGAVRYDRRILRRHGTYWAWDVIG
jgi:hypothetical protein